MNHSCLFSSLSEAAVLEAEMVIRCGGVSEGYGDKRYNHCRPSTVGEAEVSRQKGFV